jgi:UDP-N-acetylmuramoylalanine--D-glutamate ligase
MSPGPLRSLRPGEPVLVLGLGSFGGGAGSAAALCRLGARVTVTDLRQAEDLGEARALLDGLPVDFALGGHPEALFQGQLVVVNPAVPATAPVLALARERGCRLTTQVNLALEALGAGPALAVTGTHGKSTCVSLAAHLLDRAGLDTALAGNLGGSFLEAALDSPVGRRWVLELSSFQLERLEAPVGWPATAVLTSLGDDHLDRHGDRVAYWAAKRRLLEYQDAEGLLVLPAGLADAPAWEAAARGRVAWTSSHPLPAGRGGWFVREDALVERLDGRETTLAPLAAAPFAEPYRLPSLLGALAGARRLGLPAEAVEEGLRSWPGLPHRMQQLPAPAGRRWIDNGVATHPEPTAAALAELPEGTVLCAGGYDKGLDLEALAAACRRCAEVHLSGPGGARLAPLLAAAGVPHSLHTGAGAAMRAALAAALESPGVLLYSPSFSSFDEFRNFRDRARLFQDLCREFARPGISPR